MEYVAFTLLDKGISFLLVCLAFINYEGITPWLILSICIFKEIFIVYLQYLNIQERNRQVKELKDILNNSLNDDDSN